MNNNINRENLKKSKALYEEYREIFKKVIKKLKKDVLPGEERENAVSDFIDMLVNVQNDQTAVNELLPDGFEAFYQSLLEALPALTNENKRSYKHKKTRRVFGWIFALSALLLIFMQIGYALIHFRFGLEYIADYIFYVVNSLIILFAALSVLLFSAKKRCIF